MSTKKQSPEDAVDPEKVEERKARDAKGNVTKNAADTNPALDHGDPEQREQPASVGADSDDKKATHVASVARGPMGVAQDESDGWGEVPVQMREE